MVNNAPAIARDLEFSTPLVNISDGNWRRTRGHIPSNVAARRLRQFAPARKSTRLTRLKYDEANVQKPTENFRSNAAEFLSGTGHGRSSVYKETSLDPIAYRAACKVTSVILKIKVNINPDLECLRVGRRL
jgi:hypothetical protein